MKELINKEDLNKEYFLKCILEGKTRQDIGNHFNRNSTWAGKKSKDFGLNFLNEKSNKLNSKIKTLPNNLTKKEVSEFLEVDQEKLNRMIKNNEIIYNFKDNGTAFEEFLLKNPTILKDFKTLWDNNIKQGEIMNTLNIKSTRFQEIRKYLRLERDKEYFSKCSKEVTLSEDLLKKRNESIHKAWLLRNEDQDKAKEFSNKMKEIRLNQEFQKHKEIIDSLEKDDNLFHWQELKVKANLKPCSSNLPEYLKKYSKKNNNNESYYEIKVKEILDELNINYIRRTRKIISPKELDFYLPDYNIAIEVDEVRGHNSDYNYLAQGKQKPKPKNYHKNKTDICKSKGIRLIHITELDIIEKYDQLKYYLISLLNKNSNVIYGRKCKLKIVERNEEKEFLNLYHLQGYRPSNVCLGLYYNNELVFIMSFSKGRSTISSRYDYEILRLCSKGDYNVVGGSSKCFKYFINNYDFETIVSYCDLSKFIGNVYNNLGMKFLHESPPNYLWVRYDNHLEHYTRYETQKHKLVEQGYNKEKTSVEIMLERGFVRFYNCGNNVYIYTK